MLDVGTIRKLSDLADRLRQRREEEDARLIESVIAEVLDEAEGERVLAREYLTTGQAARRIGVSLQTIKNWIAAGKLPAKKVGGRYYVPRDAVQAYLDRLRAKRPEGRAQAPRDLDPVSRAWMQVVAALPTEGLARYEQLAEKQAAGQP